MIFSKPFFVILMLMTWLMLHACSFDVLPAYREEDGFTDKWSESPDDHCKGKFSALCEIDSNVFRQSLCQSKFTWLMIGATWCPHAMNDWESLANQQESLRFHGVQPLVVFPEYRIRYICRRSRAISWNMPLFVLSHASYGGRVEEKTARFLTENGIDSIYDRKLPRHYLLNQKGEVVFKKTGSLTDVLDVIRWLEGDGEMVRKVKSEK